MPSQPHNASITHSDAITAARSSPPSFQAVDADTECVVDALASNVDDQPTIIQEIDPEEGMCFGTLEEARDYYHRYVEMIGFVVKIRNTNWETKDGDRVPINQSLHCNKDEYRVSRVKAPKRQKTVASASCRARCYISFDKAYAC
ncbi:hypothetical protein PIB30_076773 [Stylosanthes scabra]|uniref:FAR1 domain-containing protein n=1 Tax=Stylosanthes scabra TaxID=79078 RepID=A0ABU6SQT3_9FABA|nr:hypothetical protein [Stylosanthes scabra]